MKHLVLVGLPGAGKSTLGRAVAAQLGLEFFDFDEEIQRRTGLSPSAFFARHGEAAFRAQELALSKEVAQHHHTIVVAPGGGWITQEAAREALRPHAQILYLRVSPKVAADRLGPASRERPLLAQGDPVAELERLLAKRSGYYESADFALDTEGVGIEELTFEVAALARRALEEPG